MKMFVWSDGAPLTIDQLENDSEDGILGFTGASILTEHMTQLFGIAQPNKNSLPPAD